MAENNKMAAKATTEWQDLIRRETVAWPTLLLFAGALAAYVLAILGGVRGWLPVPVVVLINAVATYWFFTVFHEAAHNAISQQRWLNDGLGRLSILSFAPGPIFRAFRFLHMQHHRFANERDGRDPDYWCGSGHHRLLPLRWATLDVHYFLWYLRRCGSRPRSEQLEGLLAVLSGVATLGWIVWQGWAVELFWFWFVPGRMASFMLALVFDYLPHWPYQATHAENPYQATSIRTGCEWLLTPALLCQNYHLVHHLYPRVPFYRMRKVWLARQAFHLQQHPLTVTAGGRVLDFGEVSARRSHHLV